jgi:hypothetical protein
MVFGYLRPNGRAEEKAQHDNSGDEIEAMCKSSSLASLSEATS